MRLIYNADDRIIKALSNIQSEYLKEQILDFINMLGEQESFENQPTIEED